MGDKSEQIWYYCGKCGEPDIEVVISPVTVDGFNVLVRFCENCKAQYDHESVLKLKRVEKPTN